MVVDGVDEFGGVEEVADDDGGVEVVVHSFLAFGAEGGDVDGGGFGWGEGVESVEGLHEAVVAFFGGL